MTAKNTSKEQPRRCPSCNNSYGRHGKSPDGIQLGPWIPCQTCRPNR